jgi:hypothetical protein
VISDDVDGGPSRGALFEMAPEMPALFLSGDAVRDQDKPCPSVAKVLSKAGLAQ